MSAWSWNTDILTSNDKCSHCRETLRVRQDQGIVKWTDGQNYHTYCLLDWLSHPSTVVTAETATAPYWYQGVPTP